MAEQTFPSGKKLSEKLPLDSAMQREREGFNSPAADEPLQAAPKVNGEARLNLQGSGSGKGQLTGIDPKTLFGSLAHFVVKSDRAADDNAREALCHDIDIDIEPGELQFLHSGRTYDFAIDFVHYLYDTGGYEWVLRLCDKIIPVFRGDRKNELAEIQSQLKTLWENSQKQAKNVDGKQRNIGAGVGRRESEQAPREAEQNIVEEIHKKLPELENAIAGYIYCLVHQTYLRHFEEHLLAVQSDPTLVTVDSFWTLGRSLVRKMSVQENLEEDAQCPPQLERFNTSLGKMQDSFEKLADKYSGEKPSTNEAIKQTSRELVQCRQRHKLRTLISTAENLGTVYYQRANHILDDIVAEAQEVASILGLLEKIKNTPEPQGMTVQSLTLEKLLSPRASFSGMPGIQNDKFRNFDNG